LHGRLGALPAVAGGQADPSAACHEQNAQEYDLLSLTAHIDLATVAIHWSGLHNPNVPSAHAGLTW
jgi:hypothetical protein